MRTPKARGWIFALVASAIVIAFAALFIANGWGVTLVPADPWDYGGTW